MTTDCVFCQIIQGSAPAARVYEDDRCLAFMDIHPLGRGHVLVVPRQHAVQITDLDTTMPPHLFDVAQRVLKAQRSLGWGLDGTHVLLNDGKTANQTLPHVHIHIIPRERGDGLRSAGRLLLHVTGLFGPRSRAQTLQDQAHALQRTLESAPA